MPSEIRKRKEAPEPTVASQVNAVAGNIPSPFSAYLMLA